MSFFSQSHTQQKGYLRWYEHVPVLHKAFNALEALPILCASGIAQGALAYVKPPVRHDDEQPQPKNLDSDKLQGLLKSKKKRRWYDQDPLLHQVVNQIYLMTPQQQTEIGLRLVFCIQSSLPAILQTVPGLDEVSKRAYQDMIADKVEGIITLPLVQLQVEANQAQKEVIRLQEEKSLPLFEQMFEISRSLQIRESRIRE
jgi:hypothetical protein